VRRERQRRLPARSTIPRLPSCRLPGCERAAGFAYRGSEWFESKLGFLCFVVGLDDSDPSFIGTAHRKLLDAGLVEAELIAAAQSDLLNWSEHPEACLMIAGIFVAGRVHA